MPSFSKKSLHNLVTCHPDLERLFKEVIKHRDCSVLCGHRTEEKQQEAYDKGYSKVKFPNSRHNKLPSTAVDVVPYPIDWDDKEEFTYFAGFVLGVASQMGIEVEWGGRFKNFYDGPHFQLKEK
jgi:peptidoglycan L-alanyl-D-glutamate endopeptidase CwlK